MTGTALDSSIFYDNADVAEDGWRSAAVAWATDGVIRDNTGGNFAVGTGVGRAVTVNGGNCWIRGNKGTLNSPATVALATNSSGQTRIDRIILRNDFVNNQIVYDVLQGTPGASPAPPALTQNTAIWEISLAQITLATGYSSISSGNIFDERSFSQGRPAGGPDIVACAALRTTNLAVPVNTPTTIPFDATDEYDTASIHNPSSSNTRFTVRAGMAGLWCFTLAASFEAGSGGLECLLLLNGSTLRVPFFVGGPDVPSNLGRLSAYYECALNSGDYIEWQVSHDSEVSSGSQHLTGARGTARYIGPMPVV